MVLLSVPLDYFFRVPLDTFLFSSREEKLANALFDNYSRPLTCTSRANGLVYPLFSLCFTSPSTGAPALKHSWWSIRCANPSRNSFSGQVTVHRQATAHRKSFSGQEPVDGQECVDAQEKRLLMHKRPFFTRVNRAARLPATHSLCREAQRISSLRREVLL